MMLQVYFAQKAFTVHRDCLLAVRRDSSDSNQPCRWEVPGGRLEAGEDLDQHLAREVFEETGTTITPGEPFFIWRWNIKQQTPGAPDAIVAVARICSALTTEFNNSGRVAGDNLDLTEWIPLSKVREYDWIPNMLPVLDAFLAKIQAASVKGASDRK